MEWIQKFPNYWVLMCAGQEVASVGKRGKTFFAEYGPYSETFTAWGIFSFEKVEF